MSLATKYVIEHYEENPGIFEDDQFLCNNTYVAVSHAADMALIAPIFYKGQRVGFSAACSHQFDVGGMDPGGIMVRPTEWYQEGMQFPGVKYVERGRIRQDIVDFVQSSVRTPVFTGMELASKVAANNVIKAKVVELCERYGVETVLTLLGQIQDTSEKMVRAKLRKIPDGKWRAIHYNEGLNPEVLPWYKLVCTLTKEGDTLTYDMTGTSAQSPQCENSGYPAAVGNLLGAYVVTVCHDIPWNSGIHRPLKFIIPEGTVANPVKPGACSYSTPSGSGYFIEGLGAELMAKMLQASEEDRKESCGVMGATGIIPAISGINKQGEYFVTEIVDRLAGGGGGLPDRDGDNTTGNMWSPTNAICDVEMNEALYPIMTLYRREVPDIGGPGKFRGGNSLTAAFVPWDTPSPWVTRLFGDGFDARSGTGVSGGYPAAHTAMFVLRNSDVKNKLQDGELPGCVEEITGERDYCYPKALIHVNPDDVFVFWNGGGGGYGDPLERDPELVLQNVRDGDVTIGHAREAYGVAIDQETMSVNIEATESLRKEMRDERLREGVI